MDKEAQEKIVEAYCYRNGWDYSPGNEDTDEAYKDVSFILSKAEEFGYRKLPKDKPPLLSPEDFIRIFTEEQKRQGVPDKYNFPEAIAGNVHYHQILAQEQRKTDIEWYEKGGRK